MHLYQVDAFTATPFRGNPAAVCLLDGPRPDGWMLALAAEMNLSETAFLLREGEGWRLRWFTPVTEVSLCGHATLASAHALWTEGHAPVEASLQLHTLSGELVAHWRDGWIELDFPARHVSPADRDPGVVAALGVTACGLYLAQRQSGPMYLVEVSEPEVVRAAQPNLAAVRAMGIRAVILTAQAQPAPGDLPPCDFVSRFFAPGIGIDEDPVTGSAHCYLAPFWAERLGKTELVGYQASARGGLVGCEWRGERVLLRGQAITVLRGELLV